MTPWPDSGSRPWKSLEAYSKADIPQAGGKAPRFMNSRKKIEQKQRCIFEMMDVS
jgi:hypothetical protein